MNILITSCSKKVLLVKSFKTHINNLGGLLFVTDININSPAYSFSEGTLVLSFAPTTLTLSTIASHVHSIEQATAVNAFGAPNYNIIKPVDNTMVTALSSGAHTHSDVNASMPNTTRVSSTNTYLNVSYRDCIIATKD
jgi:hypothetical protein